MNTRLVAAEFAGVYDSVESDALEDRAAREGWGAPLSVGDATLAPTDTMETGGILGPYRALAGLRSATYRYSRKCVRLLVGCDVCVSLIVTTPVELDIGAVGNEIPGHEGTPMLDDDFTIRAEGRLLTAGIWHIDAQLQFRMRPQDGDLVLGKGRLALQQAIFTEATRGRGKGATSVRVRLDELGQVYEFDLWDGGPGSDLWH